MKKIIITILLIIMPSLAQGDITTGLQAYWKFNEGTGTTTADSSGNGYTGTLDTASWAASGYIGAAITGGYVAASNPTTATNNVTYTAWVKWDGNASTLSPILESGNGSSNGYSIFIFGGTSCGPGNILSIIIAGDTCNATNSSTVLSANVWHMVTMVLGPVSGNVYLYVDGELSSSGTGAIVNAPVGSIFICDTHLTVDEARVYNRALSANDIAQLYAYTGVSYTNNVDGAF